MHLTLSPVINSSLHSLSGARASSSGVKSLWSDPCFQDVYDAFLVINIKFKSKSEVPKSEVHIFYIGIYLYLAGAILLLGLFFTLVALLGTIQQHLLNRKQHSDAT